MKSLLITLVMFGSAVVYAAENCTPANKKAVCSDEVVKAKTKWACDLATAKKEGSLREIKQMRYDCCGEPNYVWINDLAPKMVMHPIKPQLDGKDLSGHADPAGKKLFVEFVKAVNSKPEGDWVDYLWTKFGESDPTPKKSWVMKCNNWVVGSGTWK